MENIVLLGCVHMTIYRTRELAMKDVQFNDNSNDKSGVKGFKVTTKIQGNPSDDVRLLVIVYGPNTLNKPTLDKSGLLIHLNDHGTATKTFAFTSWKVPKGSEIKACIVNVDTHAKDCTLGESHARNGSGTEMIHLSADTEPVPSPTLVTIARGSSCSERW